MNIEHFKMFVRVVEQKNISRVAENMNLSQSALSQQLRVMEQGFGASLLERGPKGVVPTEAGRIVYDGARKITAVYDEMGERIEKTRLEHKVLQIVATPTVYSYALPCAFFHVKNKFPAYSFAMKMLHSTAIEEKIAQRDADLGVIIGRPEKKTLSSRQVFTDRMFLVAGQKTRIPAAIHCSEFYDYPLLMLNQAQKTRRLLDQYLRQLDIDVGRLQILQSFDSTESIKLSVINSFGLAFLPYMAIKKELYLKQLRIVQCDCFQFENSYYTVKQKSGDVDPEPTRLIAYIEKKLAETIC